MRVLQIGADRSKRGILYRGSPAFKRQEAYARTFGNLDIIAFSTKRDGARYIDAGALRIYPTSAPWKLLYAFYAVHIARTIEKPDVVSAQDPFEAGWAAWIIAAILRAPLHIQVHTDFLSSAYTQLSLLNRARVMLAGFVLRRARRIRVVSDRIKRSIEKRYALRVPITVLPIFADTTRFAVGLRDGALEKRFAAFSPKFLVVARLEKEKNVELAIRAYAAAAHKEAALIIIGEGGKREDLVRLTHELGAKHVFFEGDRELPSYMAIADLVLVPSKYEGYGLVIVEALAAGKPVLATDVGVARAAGAIVASEESFADALTAWIHNGPRDGSLKIPRTTFEEYVAAYCADIRACIEI